MLACEKKEKKSQYKGVYRHKQVHKWYVLIYPKGQKRKYGGMFNDELDAAKRVNQLCEELRIPSQNPEISAMPNQQYQVTKKFVYSHVIVRKSKLQTFIFFTFPQILLSEHQLRFKSNIFTFSVFLQPKINLSWTQSLL